MSDTALTRAVLELTHKIQLHFPSGIDPRVVQAWNGVPVATLTAQLQAAFGHDPSVGGPVEQVKAPPKRNATLLLDPLGIVSTPATPRFVVAEHFTEGKFWLGDRFKAEFLDKVEEVAPKRELRRHKLRKRSYDGPIIAELGGESVVETSLGEVYNLTDHQAKGEKGVLLTNGAANIFYIRNSAGVLRAVYVYWSEDRCYVFAHPLDDSRWFDGFQVFSRNSVLVSSATVSA